MRISKEIMSLNGSAWVDHPEHGDERSKIDDAGASPAVSHRYHRSGLQTRPDDTIVEATGPGKAARAVRAAQWTGRPAPGSGARSAVPTDGSPASGGGLAAKKVQSVGLDVSAKRALMEPNAKNPSLRRQYALLGLNRSSGYISTLVGDEREENQRVMDRINAIDTGCPVRGRSERHPP